MKHFPDFRGGRSSHPLDDSSDNNEALAWEGHVNVHPESPLITKLLQSWPELRTGLAFSMVFVVGALVGGSLAVLLGCPKSKSK